MSYGYDSENDVNLVRRKAVLVLYFWFSQSSMTSQLIQINLFDYEIYEQEVNYCPWQISLLCSQRQ